MLSVRLAIAAMIAAAPIAGSAGPAAAPRATLTNPLLPSGPDPWIAHEQGMFYYMATRGDRLTIRRTRDLAQLAKAPEHLVWRPPVTGPNAKSIWAPELHRIDGKWFIYYTAVSSEKDDDAHRGIFVLENDAADPLAGRWIDRGRVNTRLPGLDGTVFVVGDRRYFAYSAYDGPDSVLAIAPMANPWTLGDGETIIARPDRVWERQGGRQILEAPAFLQGPRGDLFLAYSASACWSDDYALGLLSAPRGSDPLAPGSWAKAPQPVLAKALANNVYAPGHNGFFTTQGGREAWIIYHANEGANAGCSPKRSPRVQRMRWRADGRPIFPVPARAGASVPAPRP